MRLSAKEETFFSRKMCKKRSARPMGKKSLIGVPPLFCLFGFFCCCCCLNISEFTSKPERPRREGFCRCIQLFRERLPSKRSIKAYATMPRGIMIMVNCRFESTKTLRQCYRNRHLEIHAHVLLLTLRYQRVSKFSQMFQAMN